jgi:hypothetical protein
LARLGVITATTTMTAAAHLLMRSPRWPAACCAARPLRWCARIATSGCTSSGRIERRYVPTLMMAAAA